MAQLGLIRESWPSGVDGESRNFSTATARLANLVGGCAPQGMAERSPGDCGGGEITAFCSTCSFRWLSYPCRPLEVFADIMKSLSKEFCFFQSRNKYTSAM